MKKFNIVQLEQNIKRYLKKKVSISKSLLIIFCMTGLFNISKAGDTSNAVAMANLV